MDIQELLNRTDRFAANAGCRITEVDGQHAVAQMTVTAMHLNGGNVCQGGALVRVTNQEGRLICHVTGMGYRKNVLM